MPFAATEHLTELVAVLHRVRAANPTYPPQSDADATDDSFAAWLDVNGTYLSRWVALCQGRVVGHVAMSKPHDYIDRFLAAVAEETPHGPFEEVEKFFVDPTAPRIGVATELFARACEFAASVGHTPILAVISTSEAARRLYSRIGMNELGTFEGSHGTNHIFVDAVEAPIG